MTSLINWLDYWDYKALLLLSTSCLRTSYLVTLNLKPHENRNKVRWLWKLKDKVIWGNTALKLMPWMHGGFLIFLLLKDSPVASYLTFYCTHIILKCGQTYKCHWHLAEIQSQCNPDHLRIWSVAGLVAFLLQFGVHLHVLIQTDCVTSKCPTVKGSGTLPATYYQLIYWLLLSLCIYFLFELKINDCNGSLWCPQGHWSCKTPVTE